MYTRYNRQYFFSNTSSLSYCLSKCYGFAIEASYGVGDKLGKMISLWKRPLITLENDFVPPEGGSGNLPGDVIAEIEIGEGKDHIQNCYLKFSPDCKTLCVMIDNDNEDEENYPESYFCEAHFYKCHLSGNEFVLEKLFSLDALSIGVYSCKAVFNVFGDKIAMTTESSILVYSLQNRSVLATFEPEELFKGLHWSYDLVKDEVLVFFHGNDRNKIVVTAIDYENSTMNILRRINVTDFIPNFNISSEIRVSSGTSLIMLGFQDRVYLIDPFTGQLLQELKYDFDSKIQRIEEMSLNWCSNEIVVIGNIFNGECLEYFCNIFKLKTGRVESLLHSALKVVLSNYPVNDLMKLNLPRSIKKFFV